MPSHSLNRSSNEKLNLKINNKQNRPNNSWTKYICHQRPERCFELNGKPMPICSRCLGVYSGLIIGFLLPVFIPRILFMDPNILLFLMLLFLAPMAIDGLTQLLGLRQSNNILRFCTGLVAGLLLGIVFSWLLLNILFL